MRCRGSHGTCSSLGAGTPLGISFFTFHQIGYQIDRWRGRASEHNLLEYALFVTFFAQLIAGPIVRQSEFLPQLQRGLVACLGARNILIGLTIFSIGLFKKVIFADSFALYATPVFDTAAKGGVLDGADGMARHLLPTRSRSTSIFPAIRTWRSALRRMVGIKLPDNFNAPYVDRSITEFWRRWHITLSHAGCATTSTSRSAAAGAAAAAVRQSAGGDAALRPVARGGVDLRGVGRLDGVTLRFTGFGYDCFL